LNKNEKEKSNAKSGVAFLFFALKNLFLIFLENIWKSFYIRTFSILND